jgi:hypothetical protein
MRIERVGTLGAVLAVVIACVPASLQAQPAVISSLLRDIDQLEQKLIGLAEAMPPAAMEWRPAEGVRSMNEVLMHVAADNYFLPTAAGVDAPAGTGIRANDYPTVQAYETPASDEGRSDRRSARVVRTPARCHAPRRRRVASAAALRVRHGDDRHGSVGAHDDAPARAPRPGHRVRTLEQRRAAMEPAAVKAGS